jgi:hypothetical protein
MNRKKRAEYSNHGQSRFLGLDVLSFQLGAKHSSLRDSRCRIFSGLDSRTPTASEAPLLSQRNNGVKVSQHISIKRIGSNNVRDAR